MKKQILVAMSVTLLSGCAFFNSLIDQSLDKAGQVAGNAIGDRMGRAVAGHLGSTWGPLNSELTQATALGLFTSFYYAGGYAWNGKAYQPGEYTQWEAVYEGGYQLIEKAFLKREADKREWWRLRSKMTYEEGEQEEVIFEALFSAPDKSGIQRIVRMRAKLPGQNAGEIPITDANKDRWVLSPAKKLSRESLDGATVGWETVKVPAGTYKARHVKYAGNLEWWLVDTVPGGVIKFSVADEEERSFMILQKVGTDSKPMLGK